MNSKKSQELNHTNERNYVAPADAPPSYSEAMGNSPCRATAPLLETDSTKPSTNDVYPPNQYPQQGPPPVYSLNDPRFADWDDRATNILITNRLRMNDQFNEARNQQERDLLWNVILAQLINDGFTNILLHGMIEYWQFQYYVYQAISNGLTVNHCDNWQYFEPMHNVFGGSGGSGFTSDVLSSGSNLSPSTGTSLDPAGPAVTSNQALEAPSSTLPNQESISVQTLPDTSASSNVTSVVDLPSSAQPLPDVSATGDAVAVSDSLPLLGQSNGDLLPTSSTVAEAANLPTLGSTADVVSASAVTPSLGDTVSGDILQSGDTTNLLSGINFTGTDVATSQPIGESLLPTMLSSDVITSQPTFSSPPLTVGDATDSNGCCAGDGGCCADDGCCGPDGCWATDDCCGDVDCCGSCDCCTGCDACGDCGDCTGADCGDCFVC